MDYEFYEVHTNFFLLIYQIYYTALLAWFFDDNRKQQTFLWKYWPTTDKSQVCIDNMENGNNNDNNNKNDNFDHEDNAHGDNDHDFFSSIHAL